MSDTSHGIVRKHFVLSPVSKSTCLLDEGGREAMGIRPVVNQLGGDVVVDLEVSD